MPFLKTDAPKSAILAATYLSALFGLDIATPAAAPEPVPTRALVPIKKASPKARLKA